MPSISPPRARIGPGGAWRVRPGKGDRRPSARSAGGQRHYTADQVERVEFIQRMYAAGLSSRTVAEVLPCVESPSAETSDAAMARMEQERDRLSAHIDELIRTRDALDRLMAVNREHRASPRGTQPDRVRSGGRPPPTG
ncbi:MerR family transcriptional regulator [Nocardia rhamnosiphila]